MKKIIILVTIILTQQFLFGSEKLSIVLFDFYGNDLFEEEAGEINSQLKVDLINSGRFEIISAAKLQEEMMNQGIISFQNLSIETASKISGQLEAAFFLKGEIKAGDFSSTITVEFVQAVTGDIILTKELPLIKGQSQAISRSITTDIIAQSNLISNIKPEDIALLINRRDFQSAEKLLQRYRYHFGETDESQKYGEMINKGLAEEQYNAAQEYLKVFDFDNALLAINKAMYFDPENFIYRDYSEVILDEQDSFMNAKLDEILIAMRKLIEGEKYDSAEILLERATAMGFQSDEFKSIARRIREGKNELALWESAQSKLWARKYVEARVDITEAIRLNPQKREYTEFLLELEKQEKESQTVSSTWNRYKKEFGSINATYLFGINKSFDEMLALGVSLVERHTFEDQLTFDEISYPGFSLNLRYFKTWPTGLNPGFEDPISSGGLLYTVIFSAMYENFISSEISRDINGYDQQDKIIYNELDISATGGVSFSLFSFVIGLGFEAGLGGGLYNHQRSVPSLDEKESIFTVHFTPSLGLDTWFAWNMTDTLSFLLSYSYKHVFSIPAYEDLKSTGEHHFMISMGYRGFDWW